MNTENLFPVGMLIVGWLLNELSRGLKTGGERRRVMAQTICQFFLHLDDLRLSYHRLREMPKAVKALGSIEKAEAVRLLSESRSEINEKRRMEFTSLAKQISAFDPVLGYDLYSFMPDLDEMNLLSLGKTPEAYSRALAMRGGFIGYYIDKVESLCRRLAWRCSLISYVRVRRHLRFLRTATDRFKAFAEILDQTFSKRDD